MGCQKEEAPVCSHSFETVVAQAASCQDTGMQTLTCRLLTMPLIFILRILPAALSAVKLSPAPLPTPAIPGTASSMPWLSGWN